MALGLDTSAFVDQGQQYLKGLAAAHRAELQALELLDSHYQGVQPLSYMHPELLMRLGDRMRQVVVAWPELVISSIEERLDVEGFRLGGEAEADERLWSFWQANGLDVGSHQAHVDSLVMKRSYIVVGTRGPADVDPSSGVDQDVPLITWQSPLETYAARDPRTRRVMSAATWWDDQPLGGGPVTKKAALYLPGSTSWWRMDGGAWVLDEDSTEGVDEHRLGIVPVVPLVNRPRTSHRSSSMCEGWSDLEPVIPLSDAACKAATDMMVTAEYHAFPRRVVIGAKQEDFVDAAGNPISAFSSVMGQLWGVEDPDAKVLQFPESSLSNYHDTIKLLAQLVASVTGLPPHYLGSATDNPASADAIRSSEARLVCRAERKQRALGEGWEQVMRIALLVADGEVPPNVRSMETVWRDASTPTIAQSADAAVKLYAGGVVPRRQIWEDLGYSAVQQDRMQEEFDREAQRAAASFGLGPDPQMPGDAAALAAAEGAAVGEPAATQTARVTYTTAAPAAPAPA